MHAGPCGDVPNRAHALSTGMPRELLHDAVRPQLDAIGRLPAELLDVVGRRLRGVVRVEHMPDHAGLGVRPWLCGEGDHGASRITENHGLTTVAGRKGGTELCRTALYKRLRRSFHVFYSERAEPVRRRTARERLLVQGPDHRTVVSENPRVEVTRSSGIRRAELDSTKLDHGPRR